MFGRGRYNRQRYNLAYTPPMDIYYHGEMAASVLGNTNVELHYHAEAEMTATVRGKAQVVAGMRADAQMHATFGAAAKGRANYHTPALQMTATVEGALQATANIYIVCEMAAEVRGHAAMSTNVYLAAEMEATMGASLRMGQRYYAQPMQMLATVFALTSTIRYDTYYIIINAEIPPGASIVIDSNRYTVLLDGENALDKHQGDWLMLSGRTYDVQVQAIGGTDADIDKQILYVVRWL